VDEKAEGLNAQLTSPKPSLEPNKTFIAENG